MTQYTSLFPGPGTTADVLLVYDITDGTKDVPNNRTLVSYNAYLYKASSGGTPFNNNNQSDVVAHVNGVLVINTGNQNYDFRSPHNYVGATQALGSGSVWVTHNSDGTKTVAFDLSFNDLPSDVIGDTSISTSLVLTPIDKTIGVKVAGVWQKALVWVKVAGVWHKTRPFVKVAGVWKNPV